MSNKKGPVIFAGLGDGASEEGVFWETLIIAAYKNYQLYLFAKIIIILLSHLKKRQSGSSIATRAKSFGTNSCQVFGSDICEIYKRLNNFTNLARKGDGPFLLEIFTYRFSSHVGTNKEEQHIKYRNKKEIDF